MFRSSLNLDIAGQAVDQVDPLVLEDLGSFHLALRSIVAVLQVEDGAVFLQPISSIFQGFGTVRAVYRRLQNTTIPTTDEISMITITSGVTIGKDKLTFTIFESGNCIDGFVEKRGQANRIVIRTSAILHCVWICHMTGVRVAVKIDPVPTRRKHKFGSDSIGTVFIDKSLVSQTLVFKRTFIGRSSVVKTVETNGFLHDCRLCFVECVPFGHGMRGLGSIKGSLC